MAKRIIKRTRIVRKRRTDPLAADPEELPPSGYYEAEPAAEVATPREILAEEIRLRREEVARSMAEARADVAAIDRAALDLYSLPAREMTVLAENPGPADPAIETGAQAAAEAMAAATQAVAAAGQAIGATESFLGAEAAAVDEAVIEAMRAADRSVADSVRAAEEAVAAAEGGRVADVADE